MAIKNQEVDVTNFENKLLDFQETCFLENRLKSCAKSIGLDTVRTLFYANKSFHLVIL